MAIEVSRWPKPIALLLPENLQHLARLRLCLPWQYATGVPAGWEAVGQAERSGAVACSVLLGSGLLSGLGGAQRIDGVGDWHNECSRGRCPQGGREPPPADGTKRCFRALACQTRRPLPWPIEQLGPAFLLRILRVLNLQPPNPRVIWSGQALRDDPLQVVGTHQLEEFAPPAGDG